MAAPKGNKFGLKIKDPEMRQRAYEAYCEWLSQGKSAASFTFKEGEFKCTSETLKKYFKDTEEFDSIHIKFAKAQGLACWEEVVAGSAKGINKDANTASLQMLMRNMYDWDKPQASAENNKVHVIEIAKGIRAQSLSEAEESGENIHDSD